MTLNRQIALRVEKEETPCYAFDDTTIIKDSLSITQTSLEETPNRYKIGYFDPSQNWTEIKVVSKIWKRSWSRMAVLLKKRSRWRDVLRRIRRCGSQVVS